MRHATAITKQYFLCDLQLEFNRKVKKVIDYKAHSVSILTCQVRIRRGFGIGWILLARHRIALALVEEQETKCSPVLPLLTLGGLLIEQAPGTSIA